jgi:hypothetical protein
MKSLTEVHPLLPGCFNPHRLKATPTPVPKFQNSLFHKNPNFISRSKTLEKRKMLKQKRRHFGFLEYLKRVEVK